MGRLGSENWLLVVILKCTIQTNKYFEKETHKLELGGDKDQSFRFENEPGNLKFHVGQTEFYISRRGMYSNEITSLKIVETMFLISYNIYSKQIVETS